jgi:DNA-binding NarL/FixJ family response regulator
VTLRSRDLQAVLSFVGDAQDSDAPEALSRELLDRLTELVGCEFATYTTVDWQRRIVTAYVHCSNEDDATVPSPYVPETFWTKPRPPHTTDAAFMKLSDVYDRRERERIRDEEEYNAEFRIMDRLGFRIYGAWRATNGWLSFDTQHRDFGDRDRALADVLRPHIVALWRRSLARRQVAELAAALERDEAAIVVVEADARITHATADAKRLLVDWFGTRNGRLPDELRAWLALASPGERYTARRNGSQLTVQAAGDFTLTLSERAAPGPRLTPRERQVLGLVGKGLTNAEIARELWVEPSTVAKHLEQAYGKLGVHNRTAAVARLAETPA